MIALFYTKLLTDSGMLNVARAIMGFEILVVGFPQHTNYPLRPSDRVTEWVPL